MIKFTVYQLLEDNHFDIINGDGRRLFAIRGEGGSVYIRDERHRTPTTMDFKSVIGAMNYITMQLIGDK